MFDLPGTPVTTDRSAAYDGTPTSWLDVARASVNSMLEVDNANSRGVAIEQAADEIRDSVRRAGFKGPELENPMRAVLGGRSAAFGGEDPIDRFERERHEVADRHPELRDLLRLDRSLTELARERARAAEERATEAAARYGGYAPTWTATLGGGIAGSFYDPINLMSLAAGPWGRVGVGMTGGWLSRNAGHLAYMGVKTGAVNAATELAIQPAVQAWRREAELEYGLSPAAFNIAAAFGLGFGLDVGIRGGSRLVRPLVGQVPRLNERGLVEAWDRPTARGAEAWVDERTGRTFEPVIEDGTVTAYRYRSADRPTGAPAARTDIPAEGRPSAERGAQPETGARLPTAAEASDIPGGAARAGTGGDAGRPHLPRAPQDIAAEEAGARAAVRRDLEAHYQERGLTFDLSEREVAALAAAVEREGPEAALEAYAKVRRNKRKREQFLKRAEKEAEQRRAEAAERAATAVRAPAQVEPAVPPAQAGQQPPPRRTYQNPPQSHEEAEDRLRAAALTLPGEHGDLIRRAEAGDIDALEELLAADPDIANRPSIRAAMQMAKMQEKIPQGSPTPFLDDARQKQAMVNALNAAGNPDAHPMSVPPDPSVPVRMVDAEKAGLASTLTDKLPDADYVIQGKPVRIRQLDTAEIGIDEGIFPRPGQKNILEHVKVWNPFLADYGFYVFERRPVGAAAEEAARAEVARQPGFRTVDGEFRIDEDGHAVGADGTRSDQPTLYVSADDAETLRSALGDGRRLSLGSTADKVAIRQAADRAIVRGTEVPFRAEPALGMIPLDRFEGGARLVFGKPIAEVIAPATPKEIRGEMVIAEGHDRLALAHKLRTDIHGNPIDIKAAVFREADGWTESDVEVLAAKKNLNEGRLNDPEQIAVFLRKHGDLTADPTIDPTPAYMRQAESLARLSPEAWAMFRSPDTDLPARYAALVGQHVMRPEEHGEALDLLIRAFKGELGRDGDPAIALSHMDQARSILNDFVNRARPGVAEGLMGGDPGRVLYAERGLVLKEAIAEVQADRAVFRTLLEEYGRIIGVGRNQLDAAANLGRETESVLARDIILALSSVPGQVRDWLSDAAARLLSEGLPRGRNRQLAAANRIAKTEFIDKIRAALQTPEGIESLRPRAPAPLEGAGGGIDVPGGPAAKAQIERLQADLVAHQARMARDRTVRALDDWIAAFKPEEIERFIGTRVLLPDERLETLRVMAAEDSLDVVSAVKQARENLAEREAAEAERVAAKAEALAARADEASATAAGEAAPEPITPQDIDRLVAQWEFVRFSRGLLPPEAEGKLPPAVASVEADLVRHGVAQAGSAEEVRAALEARLSRQQSGEAGAQPRAGQEGGGAPGRRSALEPGGAGAAGGPEGRAGEGGPAGDRGLQAGEGTDRPLGPDGRRSAREPTLAAAKAELTRAVKGGHVGYRVDPEDVAPGISEALRAEREHFRDLYDEHGLTEVGGANGKVGIVDEIEVVRHLPDGDTQVRVHFIDADGQPFSWQENWNNVVNSGGMTDPGSGEIGLLVFGGHQVAEQAASDRLAAGDLGLGGRGDASFVGHLRQLGGPFVAQDGGTYFHASRNWADYVRGVLVHELAEAAWVSGRIADADRALLVSHANDLGVLDMPYALFRSAIHFEPHRLTADELAEGLNTRTIRGMYEGLARRDYPDDDPTSIALREDYLNREGVMHMIQLAYLGAIRPEDLGPVRHILVQYFDGTAKHMSRVLGAEPSLRATGAKEVSVVSRAEAPGLARQERLTSRLIPSWDEARQKGVLQRRVLNELGMYSRAVEAAQGLRKGWKGRPEQALRELQNAGVKPAEIEATGLRKVLAQRAGIVEADTRRGPGKRHDKLFNFSRNGPAVATAEEGGSQVTYARSANPNEYYVGVVWTQPDARRQGRSRALMQKLIEHADAEDKSLRLMGGDEEGIGFDNLRKFYRSLGFKEIGQPIPARGAAPEHIEMVRPSRTGKQGQGKITPEGVASIYNAGVPLADMNPDTASLVREYAARAKAREAVTRDEILSHLEANRTDVRQSLYAGQMRNFDDAELARELSRRADQYSGEDRAEMLRVAQQIEDDAADYSGSVPLEELQDYTDNAVVKRAIAEVEKSLQGLPPGARASAAYSRSDTSLSPGDPTAWELVPGLAAGQVHPRGRNILAEFDKLTREKAAIVAARRAPGKPPALAVRFEPSGIDGVTSAKLPDGKEVAQISRQGDGVMLVEFADSTYSRSVLDMRAAEEAVRTHLRGNHPGQRQQWIEFRLDALRNDLESGEWRDTHFGEEPNELGQVRGFLAVTDDGKVVDVGEELQPQQAQKIRDETRDITANRLFGKEWKALDQDQKTQVSRETDAARKRGESPVGVRDEQRIADLEARANAARAEMNKVAEEVNRELDPFWLGTSRSTDPFKRAEQRIRNFTATLERARRAGDDESIGDIIGYTGQVEAMLTRLEQVAGPFDDLTNQLRAARQARPGHPIVNTTDASLRVLIRQHINHAVGANADYIAVVPAQVQIERGWGTPEGMRGSYDSITPKAYQEELTDILRDAYARERHARDYADLSDKQKGEVRGAIKADGAEPKMRDMPLKSATGRDTFMHRSADWDAALRAETQAVYERMARTIYESEENLPNGTVRTEWKYEVADGVIASGTSRADVEQQILAQARAEAQSEIDKRKAAGGGGGPVQFHAFELPEKVKAHVGRYGQRLYAREPSGLPERIGAEQARELDKLGFYSQALEAAKGLTQKKGTPEQMLAQLKKAGVKDAEIQATGLDKFLQEKAVASVPPAERLDITKSGELSEGGAELSWFVGDKGEVYLWAVRTEEAQKRKGKARKLVQRVTQNADAAGMPMRLHASDEDGIGLDNLVGFYRSLGFREVEKSLGPVGDEYIDGLVVDYQARVPVVEMVRKASPAKASISRDDIVKHLTENRVEVREAVYGGDGTSPSELAWLARNAGYGSIEEMSAARGLTPEQLAAEAIDTWGAPKTKWSQYSLDPSNPTYRETVLHLGDIEAERANREADAYVAGLRAKYQVADTLPDGSPRGRSDFDDVPLTPEERGKLEELTDRVFGVGTPKPFQSGHWSEPNVIVHMRTFLAKDKDGKVVLVLDEGQSDWGQKLREGGVRDEAKIAGLKERIKNLRDGLPHVDTFKGAERQAYSILYGQGGDFNAAIRQAADAINADDVQPVLRRWEFQEPRDGITKQLQELGLANAELRTAEAATPGHPMVNTTDQWTTTAFKRLVAQAVAARADRIAITPGKVQAADRGFGKYGVPMQVKEVRVHPAMHKGATADMERQVQLVDAALHRSNTISVDGAGIITNGGRDMRPGGTLAGYLGPDLAKKVMAVTPEQGVTTIAGADMRAGGYDMEATYDGIYPKNLGKVLKGLDPEIKGAEDVELRSSVDGRTFTHKVDQAGQDARDRGDIAIAEIEDRIAEAQENGDAALVARLTEELEQMDAASKSERNILFHTFPITDRVKQSVQQGGQRLFAREPSGIPPRKTLSIPGLKAPEAAAPDVPAGAPLGAVRQILPSDRKGAYDRTPHLAAWTGLPEAEYHANLTHIAAKRELKEQEKRFFELLNTPEKVDAHIRRVLEKPAFGWIKWNRGRPEALNLVRWAKDRYELVGIALGRSEHGPADRGDRLVVATAFNATNVQVADKVSAALHQSGNDILRWNAADPASQSDILRLFGQAPTNRRGPHLDEARAFVKAGQDGPAEPVLPHGWGEPSGPDAPGDTGPRLSSLEGPAGASRRSKGQLSLEAAQLMERAGRTEVEIQKATGWHRWQGQWVAGEALADTPERWSRYPELAHLTTADADLERAITAVVADTPEESVRKYAGEIGRILDRIEGAPEGATPDAAMAVLARHRHSLALEERSIAERIAALDASGEGVASGGVADAEYGGLIDKLLKVRAMRQYLDTVYPDAADRALAPAQAGEPVARQAGVGEEPAPPEVASAAVSEATPERGLFAAPGEPLGWIGLPEVPFRANLENIARKRRQKDAPGQYGPGGDLHTSEAVRAHIEEVLATPDYAWLKANRDGTFSWNMIRLGDQFDRVVAVPLHAIRKVERGARDVQDIATAFNATRADTVKRLSAVIDQEGERGVKWPKTPDGGRGLLHLVEQVPERNRESSWYKIRAAVHRSQSGRKPRTAPAPALPRVTAAERIAVANQARAEKKARTILEMMVQRGYRHGAMAARAKEMTGVEFEPKQLRAMIKEAREAIKAREAAPAASEPTDPIADSLARNAQDQQTVDILKDCKS
jgi:GNAT superfamily N-acetyltransferase